MDESRQMTAAELAERLGAPLEGDGARLVRHVGTLDEAGPDAVAWLADQRLLKKLGASEAGVVLVPPDCVVPAGRTVIRVADPHLALCDVLRWLGPPPESVPVGVHPSATVADGAEVTGAAIGAQVSVGPRAVIGPGTQLHAGVRIGADVKIGRDCVLWPNVVVQERVTLGDRVVIHPNSTLGADGFGYLLRKGKHIRIPQVGTVVIEDDVDIGANTCIDRARTGVTRIRRGTKIDNLVQVGHNADVGEDCVIVAQCGISGSTSLGHHVVLAGQVGVIDHLRIGDNVQVLAKSGVTHDVRDGLVYRGNPATENGLFTRQMVAVRRLPKMVERLRELVRRVERLESAADDRT